jgi:drug/metabolite transporter (DMT)-like permease
LSGELVALLSALLWAVSSVLIAVGAKRLHVLPLNLVRCLISTAFFWAMLLFYGGFQALATIPSSAWLWLVVSVLGLLVVGDTFYFRSMELAGVSWAMPVASITPLWAVLLAWLLVEEPLTWSLFVGSLLVVLGIAFISRSTAQKAEGYPVDPKARRTGLLMALGVSVLWAVGQVALKPATEGTPSVVANSVRQPMAALMLLGITLFRGRWRDLQGLDRRSWAVIVAASLLGTGFGTLFFIMAIQMAGAGRTAVLTATAPMMAIPFAMLWLQEQPTRWTLFGTFLTAVGIALVV